MKKIFTLVFSLGLLTSVFAQSGHRQQNKNSGNTYQSSRYSPGGRYDNSSNTYSYGGNSQWNKNDNRGQFAYNRDNDKSARDRNFRDPDERFDSKYKRERRDVGYYSQTVRIPLLQIILGIGGRR